MNRPSKSSSYALQECFLQLQQATGEAQQCLQDALPQLPMRCIRKVKNTDLLLERVLEIIKQETTPLVETVSNLEQELESMRKKLQRFETQSGKKLLVRGREGYHAEMNGVYVEVGLHQNRPMYINSFSGWVIYYSRNKRWVFDYRGLKDGEARDDGEFEAASVQAFESPTDVALWKVFNGTVWVRDASVEVAEYDKKRKAPPLPAILPPESFSKESSDGKSRTFQFFLDDTEVSESVNSTESVNYINWDSFYSSEQRKLFPAIFPSNIHPLFNAKIPILEVEGIIDEYVSRNASLFPFKGLYLSAMGDPMYRTLSLRLCQGGHMLNMTNLMAVHGKQVEYGPSKFSACQYVAASQKAEIFHAEQPPPIAQFIQSDSEMLKWLCKDFEEVNQATRQGEKRGVWSDVINSIVDPNHVCKSDQGSLATMFETFACLRLSYVGAPVKDRSGATVAVMCLLHNNPVEQADSWLAQSKIEEVCDAVGRLFQTYNFDHNYTCMNLFEDM